MRTRGMLLALACGLAWARGAGAGVYNIHLYTDSAPDFVDRESFLRSVLPAWGTSADSAVAIWRWVVRTKRQAPPTLEGGRGLYDPILFLNSYGGLDCGYVSGALQSLYDGIGGPWATTYVSLDGHTVMEVSWDGGAHWHMFDASMNIFCRRHDGEIASAEDVTRADQCALSEALGASTPERGHDYLYHFAPELGTNPVDAAHPDPLDPWGLRRATDNPLASTRTLRSGVLAYGAAVARETEWTHIRTGWRYRLHLRRGESYTRYWRALGDTPDDYRPDRDGQNPDLYGSDDIAGGNFRGNGEWRLAPDLGGTEEPEALHAAQGVVRGVDVGGSGAAYRPAAAGVPGHVTFKVYGANVITSGAVTLCGMRSGAADSVGVAVSRDGGRHWWPAGAVTTTGDYALTLSLPAAQLGGAYEYLVRVDLLAAADVADCGLDALEIVTRTQLNPRALPRLVRGANRVAFDLGEQVESETLWPPLHAENGVPRFTETADAWENVTAGDAPDGFYDAVVRPERGGEPAHVTWRFQAPGDIVGLEYGGSFMTRYDDPEDYVALQHAFDGANFTEDGRFSAQSGWTLDGRLTARFGTAPPGTRQVWLRYALGCRHDAAWNSTGVQSALMTVSYRPRHAEFTPVLVTYGWTEHRRTGDVTLTHTQRVEAPGQRWTIQVGGLRDPTMNWVRLELAEGAGGAAPAVGYSDGSAPAPQADYDKRVIRFEWLDDVARGRPYTVSRPSLALNPDTGGGELTDGGIIPPSDYPDAAAAGLTALWAPGEPVEVRMDLGAVRTLAAFRLDTHQPDAGYGHPDSIEVALSDDGLDWRPVGVTHHDDLWSPPGDFMDFEMFDSPQFAALPAGGRLAYGYWLLPAAPVAGRYLRCRFAPRAGRGLSLSEIEAYTTIRVEDWPDREIWTGEGVAGAPARPPVHPGGPVSEGPIRRLSAAPNPFAARLAIAFELARAEEVTVDIFGVRGQRVRRLAGRVLPAGPARLDWDGSDDAGRRLPAGVYLLRVRARAGAAAQRVVLLH